MRLFKIILFITILPFFVACKKNAPAQQKEEEKITSFKTVTEILKNNTKLIKTVKSEQTITLNDGVEQTSMEYITPDDKPMSLSVLKIDLNNADVGIQMSMPNNRPIFALETVTAICIAEDAPKNRIIAAVNADYFFWNGEPVVRRGAILKSTFAENWHSFFAINKNKKPVIGDVSHFTVNKGNFNEAVGGTERLVNAGNFVNHNNSDRHPRTFIGYTAKDIVYLIVTDGRQPTHSIGMTLAEMSGIMLALGAREAINLDGGGSTTLVNKNKTTTTFEIKNKHSDPAPRKVANALTIVNFSEN